MQKSRHPRNRIVVTALFPITIVLWMIGWTLSWAGSKKEPPARAHSTVKDDGIEITTILTDQIQEYNP
jgi:hypothetical protein